jgi:hypothetical protein
MPDPAGVMPGTGTRPNRLGQVTAWSQPGTVLE